MYIIHYIVRGEAYSIQMDGVDWTIESSRNKSPRAIVRQVLAFVFGSAHQMPNVRIDYRSCFMV